MSLAVSMRLVILVANSPERAPEDHQQACKNGYASLLNTEATAPLAERQR